ncbi:LLM class flavin-dependent oxidoreductase [Knoellia sp. CPCC 206435]|uniref:LLM class flavin-dependent oxidoreductase n=1 Tax=Knoellia terrae TaxID=3404797 RepID=UPI003B431BA3
MTRRCKVGVQLPEVERFVPWPDYLDLARRVEAAGYDSIWVGDHLLYDLPSGLTRGPYEAWTTLAAVAAVTERVEIGPLVASTSFHSPAMLAKQAATVDAISQGRLIVGLGAGWNRREYDAFGFPYDRRVSRFEEAMAIIVPLLRTGRTTFHGCTTVDWRRRRSVPAARAWSRSLVEAGSPTASGRRPSSASRRLVRPLTVTSRCTPHRSTGRSRRTSTSVVVKPEPIWWPLPLTPTTDRSASTTPAAARMFSSTSSDGSAGASASVMTSAVSSNRSARPASSTPGTTAERSTPGETADLLLDLGPDINPDVTAVAVNLTAVAPTQAGFITAWDGVAGRPNVSSLNFTTGATVPVLAFVPVSHLADGQLRLTLSNGSSGSTHVLADIVGYFDRASPEGLRMRHNGNPERVGDTRSGLNTVKSPIAPNSTRGFSGLSEGWRTVDTVGMLANVTAVRPTTRTYLTVWGNETGGARPTASNLNAVAGEVVANSVITGFSSTDRYSIYNQAGSTHVIVDAQLALDVYPGADSGLSTKINPVSEPGSGRQMRSTVSRQ